MPDPPLIGRNVAVIGAGSGIGEATAIRCAEQGAHVFCLDFELAKAEAVAQSLEKKGARAEARGVDIRDAGSLEAVLERLATATGGLDGFVATPGINVRKPILAYADDEFDRVVAVNLKGSFNALRAAGRIMTAAGRGSIVLLSSIRSQVVEPGQSVYAATKAGIVQLVRTAAAEFGPSGVRVNAVAPGVVETPLTAPIKAHPEWYTAYASKTALSRWGRAEEVAGPVAFLLSDAASYMTGSVLFVDGGWTAMDGRFRPPGM